MSELLASPLALVELSLTLKSVLLMLALCTTRIYAMGIVLPPMNDQVLQGVVRNGVCLLLGLYVSWGQPLHMIDKLGTLQLTLLLLKESVLGVLLGFAAASVFWVAEGVGELIDNLSGFNSVQQNNPTSGQQSTPVGNLLSNLANACFWMLGGMTVLAGVVFESYRWWPLDRITPDWSSVLPNFLQVHLSHLMRTQIVLAAPLLLVLLLIDLGIGLLSKAADKLEPNSLGQPIKGAVALLMLALLVALFFQQAQPMLTLQNLQGELSAWLHQASTLH
jgi:type III secretion protein T